MMKHDTRTNGANVPDRPRRRPRTLFQTGNAITVSRCATRNDALLPPGTTTVSKTSLRTNPARTSPAIRMKMFKITADQRRLAPVGSKAEAFEDLLLLDLAATAL